MNLNPSPTSASALRAGEVVTCSPAPMTNILFDRMEVNHNRIAHAASRIGTVLDRLMGPVPQDATSKPNADRPQTAVQKLHEALEQGAQIAGWLDALAERVERIA